jgi:hypothetical protein
MQMRKQLRKRTRTERCQTLLIKGALVHIDERIKRVRREFNTVNQAWPDRSEQR